MSTAGRATFQAIKGTGQSSVIKTAHVSGKDQNAHTKLKYRQIGQSSVQEIKQQKEKDNLKNELQLKELKNILGNSKDTKWMISQEEEKKVNVDEILQETPKQTNNLNFEEIKSKYDDADIDFDSVSSDAKDSDKDDSDDEEGDNKKRKRDDDFDSSDDEENDSDDDDDDEEDEEAALQAELERIREERALAKARKDEEDREFQEKLAQEQALRSNPLLNLDSSSSGKMKRRWNDDVIFRNQAKDEPEYKKRFINDTVRNDFHRSFLKRYMK